MGTQRLSSSLKLLALAALLLAPIRGQDFQISSAPLRAEWGTIRSSHADPRSGHTILVFESPDGTVRLVAVTGFNEAKLIAELERSRPPSTAAPKPKPRP